MRPSSRSCNVVDLLYTDFTAATSPALKPEELLAAAAPVLELAPQRGEAVERGAVFQRPLRDGAPLPQQLHHLILLRLPLHSVRLAAHLRRTDMLSNHSFPHMPLL